MLTIILTSILIGLIFAPLGCIALWKKYVYFGDGLAHASLLAGSLSIIAKINLFQAGGVVAIFFSILIFKFKENSDKNGVINLISSLMLSFALILAHIYPSQFNLNQLLFGDIISVTNYDIKILLLILIAVVIFLITKYKQIILVVLNPDIARIHGIKVKVIELSFLILLALSIFSTIRMVGSLLITSILITPAMAARMVSRQPWEMIIIAIIIAIISNLMGIIFSFYQDVPIAPTIILIEALIYFIIFIFFKK